MYLLELFSEKENLVRLITFTLSSVLAVSVLLLNQFFSQRRTRQEYLLKKIEELAQLSIAYTDLCTKILDDLESQQKDQSIEYPSVPSNYKRELTAIIRRIEMIAGLYFKGAGFNPNHYRLWNMQLIDALEKGRVSEDYELNELFENARQHVVDSDARLAVICSKLINSFGHKT